MLDITRYQKYSDRSVKAADFLHTEQLPNRLSHNITLSDAVFINTEQIPNMCLPREINAML